MVTKEFYSGDISTHSLTRRLTTRYNICIKQKLYFNSQPHKEADYRCHHLQEHQKHFNSQPHKEADVNGERKYLDCNGISTHSLTRRLTTRCSLIRKKFQFQLTASQGG